MSADQTTDLGWPKYPGVPLNPEKEGWHRLESNGVWDLWWEPFMDPDPTEPSGMGIWHLDRPGYGDTETGGPHRNDTYHYLGPSDGSKPIGWERL